MEKKNNSKIRRWKKEHNNNPPPKKNTRRGNRKQNENWINLSLYNQTLGAGRVPFPTGDTVVKFS